MWQSFGQIFKLELTIFKTHKQLKVFEMAGEFDDTPVSKSILFWF